MGKHIFTAKETVSSTFENNFSDDCNCAEHR